ncbi:MAG: PilZ domain-containing protein [Candidatus Hydrogenedentota bacterium]
MQEDKRKTVRRRADREMIARLHAIEAGEGPGQGQTQRQADMSREQRHKRRRAIRHECKVRIALEIVHSAGHLDTWDADTYHMKGRVLDLSIDGASLFTRETLSIGQRVGLTINLGAHETFQVRGHVRWTKAVSKKEGYASGVQFDQITTKDRERVLRFLHELDETIGL